MKTLILTICLCLSSTAFAEKPAPVTVPEAVEELVDNTAFNTDHIVRLWKAVNKLANQDNTTSQDVVNLKAVTVVQAEQIQMLTKAVAELIEQLQKLQKQCGTDL